jgi:hypothetical protein
MPSTWPTAVACLLQAADRHQGLWPSLLDRHMGQWPATHPAAIPGQREHDRAPRGCNLSHDIELIGALLWWSHITGERRHADAVDRCLTRFLARCTQTPTGLFAWGEHAYWDLDRDALGNSNANAGRTVSRGAYHDHLREAPPWLWRNLWRRDPEAVTRFARGLRWHWKSGALAHEYFRHAYMECPEIPLPHEVISRDFPRHGGFYLLDTAFVLSRRADEELERQASRWAGYWWPHRHETGLLPLQSRADRDVDSERAYSVAQTVSLGVNMFDAAGLLQQAGLPLAATVREHARVFLEGCLQAPHRPESGVFAQAVERRSFRLLAPYVAWGTRYGEAAALPGLVCWLPRAARHTGDERFAHLAWQAIHWAQTQPLPRDRPICARDLAQMLRAVIDLQALAPSAQGRDLIERWVALAHELYLDLDAPLPRAAVGCDWYEAQLGSSDLLAALIHAELCLSGSPAGSFALESLP